MLSWLQALTRDRRTARKLYGAIVTAARAPVFFSERCVRDTVEGRAELLILHLFAVVDRLSAEGAPARGLMRKLIEEFVADMDGNMREMGVGDLSVPRKVKRAAAGFYERARVYGAALDSRDEARLAREVEAYLAADPASAARIAGHLQDLRRHLRTLSSAALVEGAISFPPFESGERSRHAAGGAL